MNVQTVITPKNNQDFWFARVDVNVVRDKELSITARLIFTVLCTFADKDKRGCWPDNDTVAKAAGVSVSTLKRAYKELEDRGVIARNTRFNNGQQISSYTLIVGHNASCYVGFTSEPAGGSPMSHRTRINEQDNNTLTREAELPSFTDMPVAFEDGQAVIPDSDEKKPLSDPADNPAEVCTPDDAPEIMKSTAELLLLKTGRAKLTWSEISALRTLAASQYPSRVQKEIDTACTRFTRKGRPLHTLTFDYIAGSLRHQRTRSATGRTVRKAKPSTAHQELAPSTQVYTAEDLARIEAEYFGKGENGNDRESC